MVFLRGASAGPAPLQSIFPAYILPDALGAQLGFNGGEQSRNFVPDDRQKPPCVQAEILMRYQIPQAGEPLPIHPGITLGNVWWQCLDCFTEFGESVLQRPEAHAVSVRKCVECFGFHRLHKIPQVGSRIADILKALFRAPGHQNT
jgi:hypothetical protein